MSSKEKEKTSYGLRVKKHNTEKDGFPRARE